MVKKQYSPRNSLTAKEQKQIPQHNNKKSQIKNVTKA